MPVGLEFEKRVSAKKMPFLCVYKERRKEMSNKNTPYDDAFRTLITDCNRLIIPLVNEIFGENYDLNEKVMVFSNEFFITDGDDAERITDSNFSIGGRKRKYHIECQSSPDGTIVVRVFEYATQVAKTDSENSLQETVFTLPHSAVLYLRDSERVPNEHIITIDTPGGTVSYSVPVLKVKDYSMEEMLDKKLWFLLPFYFFRYPLNKQEKDNESIEEMKKTYLQLWDSLEDMVQNQIISELEKSAIKAMCDKIATALSEHYENVKKGVDAVMGGKVLDYEAKQIRNDERINIIATLFKMNIDEEVIKKEYPDQFEAGKAKFLSLQSASTV